MQCASIGALFIAGSACDGAVALATRSTVDRDARGDWPFRPVVAKQRAGQARFMRSAAVGFMALARRGALMSDARSSSNNCARTSFSNP